MTKNLFKASAIFLMLLFTYSATADTFGTGNSEPLPNVTEIQVYNVTGLSPSNQRTDGELVQSGLNTTLRLNQTESTEYRFSFKLVNEGDNNWDILGEDQLYHDGLKSSWSVDDIYYNISSNIFETGSFSSGKVSWDTSQGGTLSSQESMRAEYIVNITEESASYNQKFKVNDTSENAGSTDQHILDLTELGYLNITLNEPPEDTDDASVYQKNRYFGVNATIECLGGECGDVEVNSRYNTSNGQEVIPQGSGKPFHNRYNKTKECGSLGKGESCNPIFSTNASGDEMTYHKIDVNASSKTYNLIQKNQTNKGEILINRFILFGFNFSRIDFGYSQPGTENQSAKGNAENNNKLIVEDYSIPVDEVWVKGTDLELEKNSELGENYSIGIGNISYSNQNDVSTEKFISNEYTLLGKDFSPGTYYDLFFWLDVPTGIFWGEYTGQITFKANNTVN